MTKISFTFKIEDSKESYPYSSVIGEFSVSGDVVPEGTDPVAYLRQRLSEEVKRAATKIPTKVVSEEV